MLMESDEVTIFVHWLSLLPSSTTVLFAPIPSLWIRTWLFLGVQPQSQCILVTVWLVYDGRYMELGLRFVFWGFIGLQSVLIGCFPSIFSYIFL